MDGVDLATPLLPDAFRQVFESAPVGIAVIDPGLRCVAANDALARLNGVSREALLGPIRAELLPGLDPDLAANVRSVLGGDGAVSVQLMGGSTPAQPGVPRAWDLTYAAINGPHGEPVAVGCTILEISERELLAEQVRVQARRNQLLAQFFEAVASADDEADVLRVLADRATDAIGDAVVVWTLAPEGEWLEAAAIDARDRRRIPIVRRFAQRRRRSDDSASRAMKTGRSVFRPAYVVPGRTGRQQTGEYAGLPVTSVIEVPLRVRGEVVAALHLIRLIEDAPRYTGEDLELAEALVARASLAVESVRARGELRRTSITLRAVLDASPLPLVATDSELKVAFWNGAAERLYGWTASEVLGRPTPLISDERRAEIEETVERLRGDHEIQTLETTRIKKNGEHVEVRLFLAPLHDASGAVTGVLAVHEEIGARKQLEAQLFEARKMETVGRLAGGVAHDFNNIMTAIIGFASLSEMDADDPELKHNLAAIRSAAERAAGLTRQLLAFGRRQMLNPRVLNVNDAVFEVEPILRRLMDENVELILSVDPKAGSLRADPTQLEQVLLNLALNARDAMPDGGELVIATETVRVTRPTGLDADLEPGNYVSITVSDTGVGMDGATMGHLFEPFFTTKEVGKGTGLGLATTYGIVKQSGGSITVESSPGRGSTFRLLFPLVADEQPAEIAPVPERGHSNARVLIVEDEPTLRDLARRVLAREGFDVRVASSALDALEIVDRDPDVDLLFSDVVMPGLSGGELALRLRQRHPDLPVVLTSGYSEDFARPIGNSAFIFVGKPFTPEALLDAVNSALIRARVPRQRAKRSL